MKEKPNEHSKLREFTQAEVTLFWSRVDIQDDADACWEWTVGKDDDVEFERLGRELTYFCYRTGYGKFAGHTAHRVAWFLWHDQEWQPGRKVVMHTCDNRKCCNPNHLKLGTHKDNTQDMLEKGRHRPPSKRSPIPAATVREIRDSNDRLYKIAETYGVSVGHIINIRKGRTRRYA